MSYCRFSSDSFGSDVYVYESWDGFIIYTASDRVVGLTRSAPPVTALCDADEQERARWLDDHRAFLQEVAQAQWVSIDHPDAGQGFRFDTAAECADELERLAGEGFRVPNGVVEDLRAEHAETVESEGP